MHARTVGIPNLTERMKCMIIAWVNVTRESLNQMASFQQDLSCRYFAEKSDRLAPRVQVQNPVIKCVRAEGLQKSEYFQTTKMGKQAGTDFCSYVTLYR